MSRAPTNGEPWQVVFCQSDLSLNISHSRTTTTCCQRGVASSSAIFWVQDTEPGDLNGDFLEEVSGHGCKPSYVSEPDSNELLAATLESYNSALMAMGKSGVRACPALGSDLERGLAGLGKRLSHQITPSLVRGTGKHVEEQLQQWGGRTAEYFKAKTNDVKELLIVLARTAESLGERDQRYSKQFTEFTMQLQTIANLDDLAQMRSSIMQQSNRTEKLRGPDGPRQ